MTRTILVIALLAILAAWGIYAVATVDRRGDEAQIRSMIADTAAAVERRDLGGTIACLSGDYKDADGMNYDRLRVVVAQALQSDSKFTTSVEVTALQITGKDASATVRAIVNGANGEQIYNRNLILTLRKEPARHKVLVPVEVWRVTNVRGLALQQVM